MSASIASAMIDLLRARFEGAIVKERTCIYCGKPGGKGPRELRPYGPSGADVCAECTFHGPPERVIEAEKQLSIRLVQPGPLVIVPEEQVGPRSSKKVGDV